MQEKEKVPQNQLFGIIDGWTLIIFSPFFIPGESHHLVAEGWVQELRLRIDPMSHGARRTVKPPLHRKWNASIRRHHMGLMWMCQNRNLPKNLAREGQLRWTFLFCLWFVRELRVVIVSWYIICDLADQRLQYLRGRSGRTRGARNHRVDFLWAWKRSFNHRRSLVIFSISTDMTWGLGVAQIL